MSTKEHWENIYSTKELNEVSWYQPKPETSIHLIESAAQDKSSRIIDVGGGDSFLMDNLIENGFNDLSVLDISVKALERLKIRLGEQSKEIIYHVSDVTKFVPQMQYDIWHDRAVFHFLTEQDQIKKYVDLVSKAIAPNGSLIIGTFSENGPDRCSGIDIQKYGSDDLIGVFEENFTLKKAFDTQHDTPFNTTQEFTFVHLTKKA